MNKKAGCIFCSGTGVYFNDIKESDFRLNIEDLFGNGLKLHVEFCGSGITIPIRHCPACGRKLVDE